MTAGSPLLSPPRRLVLATWLILLSGLTFARIARADGPNVPVWLVSNGIHTSIGLRVKDAPFTRETLADPRAKIVLIGWGSAEIYRGHVTSFSLGRAMFGSPSLLHVVSLKGPIRERFQHSDIVRLEIPRDRFRLLAKEFERSFAHDPAGHIRPLRRGFYDESLFFSGTERFYFPKICNTWLAVKLHRQGVRLCVPRSLLAPGLVAQAARQGVVETKRSLPRDGY